MAKVAFYVTLIFPLVLLMGFIIIILKGKWNRSVYKNIDFDVNSELRRKINIIEDKINNFLRTNSRDSQPTEAPTSAQPTEAPTSAQPTEAPTSAQPTVADRERQTVINEINTRMNEIKTGLSEIKVHLDDKAYIPNLKVWGFVLITAVILLIIPIIIILMDQSIEKFLFSAVFSWPNIVYLISLMFMFASLFLIIIAIIKMVRDD